jgi:glutamine amidotransferase
LIAIVDCGAGNLNSVCKSVNSFTSNFRIVSSPLDLLYARKIILPGVGHFLNAMEKLGHLRLIEILNKKVLEEKVPVLGICLGMQLLTRSSEEGNSMGLGWIDAVTVRFRLSDIRHKVPHIGWNSIEVKKKSPIINGLPADSSFYFVHSYHIKCNCKNDILSTTEYGYDFVSAIQKDNIFGTQFHPEKSHGAGETLFRNFLSL